MDSPDVEFESAAISILSLGTKLIASADLCLVHISAHETAAGILLEHTDGLTDAVEPLSAPIFCRILQARPALPLLVLATSNSLGLGKAVEGCAQHVIATCVLVSFI